MDKEKIISELKAHLLWEYIDTVEDYKNLREKDGNPPQLLCMIEHYVGLEWDEILDELNDAKRTARKPILGKFHVQYLNRFYLINFY